ncbi:hypothetical protein KY329_05600 [Candidatus Woesearchaeota archaeon]|nr:hypothetical protein [Candidatus Woesearchaeota archaeon]
MTLRAKKQPELEEEPGAPEWMVTFSDCMTLLLTFFVLLLSFSSFDDKIFYQLKSIYSGSFTAIIPVSTRNRDALLNTPPIIHEIIPEKGSEKETNIFDDTEGLMKYTGIVDLHMGLSFVIPSKKVFWGQGITISTEGRYIMDKIRSFLRKSQTRVVISEYGPNGKLSSEYYGLPRAWAVMEYITTERNIEKNRFSISPSSSLEQNIPSQTKLGSTAPQSERTVEIVLLERSIYN